MIKSFADKETEKIYRRNYSKNCNHHLGIDLKS